VTPRSAGVSLCPTCAFVREVRGRHEQRYLLCRNPVVEAKYPRQPVTECVGYESQADTERALR